MKCQILFSGKNKKNIINLSSAENAQRVVKVKVLATSAAEGILKYLFSFNSFIVHSILLFIFCFQRKCGLTMYVNLFT